jgi:hypothetical protein
MKYYGFTRVLEWTNCNSVASVNSGGIISLRCSANVVWKGSSAQTDSGTQALLAKNKFSKIDLFSFLAQIL